MPHNSTRTHTGKRINWDATLGKVYYIGGPVKLKAKDLQSPRDNDTNCISINDNNTMYECFDRFFIRVAPHLKI